MRFACKNCSSCSRISFGIIIGYSLVILVFYVTTSLSNTSSVSILFNKTLESFSKFYKNEHINNAETDGTNYMNEVPNFIYDLPENHTFKSLFIIAPKIYPRTRNTTDSLRKTKVISCYNCDKAKWFTESDMLKFNRDFKRCPYSECQFNIAANKTTADVLIFFVGKIASAEVPTRPPGQIWIMCNYESPANFYYPANYTPWRSVFNWTFNYRTDSDIFSPTNFLAWRKSKDLMPDQFYLEIAKKKTKTAAWFVSNCITQAKREKYVEEMKKYIDIDIYGMCSNLTCSTSDSHICEQILTTTYKFYLSFENSLCKDYITEKFFRNFHFRSHIVPVARGGFDYDKYFPDDILVNAAHFSTAKELALYLKILGNDHERYARMLKEKDKLVSVKIRLDWCSVCEKLHTETKSQVIPDIREWSHKGTCYNATDIV